MYLYYKALNFYEEDLRLYGSLAKILKTIGILSHIL